MQKTTSAVVGLGKNGEVIQVGDRVRHWHHDWIPGDTGSVVRGPDVAMEGVIFWDSEKLGFYIITDMIDGSPVDGNKDYFPFLWGALENSDVARLEKVL